MYKRVRRVCIAAGIVCVTAALVLLALLWSGRIEPSMPIDLSFAERVTIEYFGEAEGAAPIEVTDPDEVRRLAELMGGVEWKGFRKGDSRDAEVYRLTFSGSGRKRVLMPNSRAYGTVQLDFIADTAGCYSMGARNRIALAELLAQYGIPMQADDEIALANAKEHEIHITDTEIRMRMALKECRKRQALEALEGDGDQYTIDEYERLRASYEAVDTSYDAMLEQSVREAAIMNAAAFKELATSYGEAEALAALKYKEITNHMAYGSEEERTSAKAEYDHMRACAESIGYTIERYAAEVEPHRLQRAMTISAYSEWYLEENADAVFEEHVDELVKADYTIYW